MMCYKTVLVTLLLAVAATAQDNYVQRGPDGEEHVCLPCGPKPNPHVYLVDEFNWDMAKGTWWLVYTNDLPAEAQRKCIHWPIYPNNDTVGNINQCWNSDRLPWTNVDCGRRNGGGFVRYSRPELTDAAFFWESDRWVGEREYFVIAFKEVELLVLIRCESVNGVAKQYIYVLTANGDQAGMRLQSDVAKLIEFNSMNPRIINPQSIKQSGDCNYLNVVIP